MFMEGGANKMLMEAGVKHLVKLCPAVGERAVHGPNKLLAQ